MSLNQQFIDLRVLFKLIKKYSIVLLMVSIITGVLSGITLKNRESQSYTYFIKVQTSREALFISDIINNRKLWLSKYKDFQKIYPIEHELLRCQNLKILDCVLFDKFVNGDQDLSFDGASKIRLVLTGYENDSDKIADRLFAFVKYLVNSQVGGKQELEKAKSSNSLNSLNFEESIALLKDISTLRFMIKSSIFGDFLQDQQDIGVILNKIYRQDLIQGFSSLLEKETKFLEQDLSKARLIGIDTTPFLEFFERKKMSTRYYAVMKYLQKKSEEIKEMEKISNDLVLFAPNTDFITFSNSWTKGNNLFWQKQIIRYLIHISLSVAFVVAMFVIILVYFNKVQVFTRVDEYKRVD